MTDRQKLRDVFNLYGIEFVEHKDQITLVKGLGKTVGHYGLQARFIFDDQGFKEVELFDEFGSECDGKRPWE